MANCHKLFESFHTDIQILQSKKDRLADSKDKLRKKVIKHFAENHPEYKPKFYIQGSYKMGSATRTKDDTCDLDDGVYFLRKPDVTAATLQKWVFDAVDGHTETQHHKEKCVSVIYLKDGKEDYNIDLPVYCQFDGEPPQLATKSNGFQESDPKEVVEWFKKKKKANAQIVRIVRYLKTWCDHVRNKMPNGLAMTILACNAYDDGAKFTSDRDDETLRNVLKQIRKKLKEEWKCKVPAVPHDDLFKNYDEDRKKKFFERIDFFIEDADNALHEKNQMKASRLWRKHLGEKYFPEGEDKDEKQEQNQSTALAGVAAVQKNWYSND